MPQKKKNTKETADSSLSPKSSKTSAKAPIVKSSAAKPKTGSKRSKSGPFPIVGIGASAGGLEALESLFSKMPADTNMAFVVIQHMAPKHKSIMGSLLQKCTAMPVLEVEDGMKIASNRIYLNPPNKNVAMINGVLQLMEMVKASGVDLPIDYFFRSLSDDQNEKAVCIILSGTGTDGTLGLKAVKGGGGMAMVQQEQQAKYSGMPASAIHTGLVDFILPVEKMPDELVKYTQHPYVGGLLKDGLSEGRVVDYIRKIFVLIRSRTGHDFSNYKQTTIRRRIERRIAVHQLDNIHAYVLYMQKTPAEVDILFKEMLIGVTHFFRDTEAFEFLRNHSVPGLLKSGHPESPLRIWIPGCATGEEAYSLAILFVEVMESLNMHLPIQIFASDLDTEAIEYARTAVYPESIAADVSPERLTRFFVKEGDTYKLRKQIREMVVFAVQNLIKDPPFSKLNMISCRNVLIYMDGTLQKQLLPLFHYTLLPNGTLFLGSSESIGEFADMFSPMNSKWKIYTRSESGIQRDWPGSLFFEKIPAYEDADDVKTTTEVNIRVLAEKLVLDHYSPASVLINGKYQILWFIGSTDRYLMPPTGDPSFDIVRMAREGLRHSLRTALGKAAKEKKTIVSEGIRIEQNGGFRTVDLIIRPLSEPVSRQGLMLVVFDEKTSGKSAAAKKKKTRPAGKETDPRIASLEQELQSTREYLQTTIEELETSNEELKSTNEELQSVNEELQSTNEELETSKEELQSTNEELMTVNAELQNKVDELSNANNDISNLLASTEIGTIFLDANLRIKRFTPPMDKIFNLIQIDIGRPIGDITSNFIDYGGLQDDAKAVLDTLVRKEEELQMKDGRWYAMRIMPYRTVENLIDGVVITFVDISEAKKNRDILRLAIVVKDSNDAVTLQEKDGKILAWNRGAERMYGYSENDALEMNIRDILPDDKRKEEEDMVARVFKGDPIESYETRRRTKDGRILDVWLTATAVRDENKKIVSMATTERDITERKNWEIEAKQTIDALHKEIGELKRKEK